jgi:uncharacterized phage protein gp47/JayE
MTPTQLYNNWLEFITTRDPECRDTSIGTFNSMLAEAVAAQTYILIQLLKQKVADSSMLTAEGAALDALVAQYLPEGREAGTRSTGTIRFTRNSVAPTDYTVPSGTICAMPTEDGDLLKFETTAEVTLEEGDTYVVAPAQSIGAGNSYNVNTGVITILLTPVYGVTSIFNDAPFTGGTDQESDESLRDRALFTLWIPGKATVPLVQEHVGGVEGVREAKVTTLGQGDVLIVVDSVGGITDPESEIGDKIYEELAAGCTACGVLGASIRPGGSSEFSLDTCSGGQVWVRSLQFLSAEEAVPFNYKTTEGAAAVGSVTFPAGTRAGDTVLATIEAETLASEITASSYAGSNDFDLFMGLGTYPNLWVCPEAAEADVTIELTLTATPETDLLSNIEDSVTACLAAYRIGDTLEFSDVQRYVYVDFETGRVFQGIDDIDTFTIVCKGSTIDQNGESVAIDLDERVTPGTISVTES